MHRHLYISFRHFVCQGKGEVKKKKKTPARMQIQKRKCKEEGG